MIVLSVIGFIVAVATVMGLLRLAGRAGRGAWDGVPTSGHIARAQTREGMRLAEVARQNDAADEIIAADRLAEVQRQNVLAAVEAADEIIAASRREEGTP